jgi:hypothetical protein
MSEQEPSVEVPRLSPSIGHKLVAKSALAAWAGHRLLGNFRKPPTDTQVAGRAWHAAILGDEESVEVLEYNTYRSSEAKVERAGAEARGQTPVLVDKWNVILEGRDRIREELEHLGIVLNGKVEERIEWFEDTQFGKPVACSGVIDHRDGCHIDDIKTGPAAVTKQEAAGLIFRSHSLLQDAAYRSAISTIHGIDLERCEMSFIFIQTEEPFAITPVEMSGEFREIAYLRWSRALEMWAECMDGGTDRKHWPGPCRGLETIHPPGWALAQELELEALAS